MHTPMPTACAIAAVLVENQSRQRVLDRQTADLREAARQGHYIGDALWQELHALQELMRTERWACRWHLTRLPAANDHCGAPRAA